MRVRKGLLQITSILSGFLFTKGERPVLYDLPSKLGLKGENGFASRKNFQLFGLFTRRKPNGFFLIIDVSRDHGINII